MNKNTSVNWGGYLTLMISLVVTVVFFGLVMLTQPGPVDAVEKAPAGLSSKERIERKKTWAQTNQDRIAFGQKSYELNCAFCHSSAGRNEILERFKSGTLVHGKTELEVFTVLSKGIYGTTMKRVDYLPENERWALVHYLRSLNQTLPSTTKSEWKKYYSEQGI